MLKTQFEDERRLMWSTLDYAVTMINPDVLEFADI